VQNAGGFACLEALAAGKPTVTYRCISGHGETNAAALDRANIVPWIRSRAELGPRLREALVTPPRNLWSNEDDGRYDVVDAILPPPVAQLVTPIQALPGGAAHHSRARRHRVA
jgi:hypothetical protein